MTQIWPKRAIFEFSQKKRKRHFFPTPKTRLSTKNQQILMNGLRKKCEKSPFLGILGQNGQFLTVFGQNWQNGNCFQKSAWNIFLALTNCKVSEKSNKRFLRNCVTNEQTYKRTRAKFKDLSNSSTNQKSGKNLIFKTF